MASWPTTPEPPVRLTTLNGCFSSFSSSVPMIRAVASVPPPAPQGTISCTGRCGYCAWVAAATSDSNTASSVLIDLLPVGAIILTTPGSKIFLLEVRMNAPAQAGLASLNLKDAKLFREQCYIDGRWADADEKKTTAVHNPAS